MTTSDSRVTEDMVNAAARAIFVASRPANMVPIDWDSGALLGKDDSYRLDVIRQARAALEAALASRPATIDYIHGDKREVMEWQPIESAPRDGSNIILGYAPDEKYEFGFVGQGRWSPAEDDGQDTMGHDAGFMDSDSDFIRCGRSFGHPYYMDSGTKPTHWMPLPEPPK